MFSKDTRSYTYEYFQHSMATKTRKYMQLILRRRGQKQTPIHPNEIDKSELVRTHVKRPGDLCINCKLNIQVDYSDLC